MDNPRPTWTNTQQVIAFVLVFSFVGVIAVWMIHPPGAIDQSVMTVVNMLLGALVAKFTTVIDYFFGSSQGSKEKADTQSRVIENLTSAGPRSAGIAAAVVAAAEAAAPQAAAEAAPPAAEVAAPPAAEVAVAEALARAPRFERKPE